MKISYKEIYLVIFILLILFSCAMNQQAMFRAIDAAVSKNDFQTSIEIIEEAQAGKSPLYNYNNAISLYMDLGLMRHFAHDYKQSTDNLHNAERLISEAFTKSITQSVSTYIVNDNTREYPGEDFEDIYLSVFNALNYYKMGNLDGALVEVRKLTLPSGKLEMLQRKYEEPNEKAKKENENALKRAQDSQGASLPEVKYVSFANSALARYLSMLFYRSVGNFDAARIEHEQLQAAFTTQPAIYNHAFPSSPNSIQPLIDNVQDMSTLSIISFVGLSPIKEERFFPMYFPFFEDPTLRFAQIRLPVLTARPNRIDRVEIVVSEQRYNMELLENMGNVIMDTFNARYSQIFLKTYLRTLTKYIATDISSKAIAGKDNEGLAGLLTLTGRIISDVSERADIRMSRMLPNKAYICNINLEAGTYDVVVNYYAGRTLIKSETEENVEITNNSLNLITTVNFDNTPATNQ